MRLKKKPNPKQRELTKGVQLKVLAEIYGAPGPQTIRLFSYINAINLFHSYSIMPEKTTGFDLNLN